MDDAGVIESSLRTPDAFAVVFDRHFEAVHRYAQRRVGVALADEVAAETFARAFGRRRKYDRRHPDARPWLLGIAANVLRRHWRDERRRLAAYARAAAAAQGPAQEPGADLGHLVSALGLLSKAEREALLLYALADLSYDEIAVARLDEENAIRHTLVFDPETSALLEEEQVVTAGNAWDYPAGTVIGYSTYVVSAVVDELGERP